MGLFSSTEEKIIDALNESKFDKASELLKNNNIKVNNLFNMKFKIGKQTFQQKTTILQSAVSKHAPVSILEEIINKGADVNIITPENHNTPLHGCSDLSVIYFLLKNGANTNLRNRDGNTPVDLQNGMIDSCYKHNWGESSLNRYNLNLALLLAFNDLENLKVEVQRFLTDNKEKYQEQLKKIEPTINSPIETNFQEENFPRFFMLLRKLEIDIDNVTKEHNHIVDKIKELRNFNGTDLVEPLQWHLGNLLNECDELLNSFTDKPFSYILSTRSNDAFKYCLANATYWNDDSDEGSYNFAIKLLKEVEGKDIKLGGLIIPKPDTYYLIMECYNELKSFNDEYEYLIKWLDCYYESNGQLSLQNISQYKIFYDSKKQDFFHDLVSRFYNAKKFVEGLDFISKVIDEDIVKDDYFVEFNKELENWDELGLFYEKKGDKTKAQEYFKLANNEEKLISYSESDGDYIALAKLLEKQGDIENAAINYFKGEDFNTSQKLWLKLKLPDEYFQCLNKTNRLESIKELDAFDINDVITFSIKHNVSIFAAEYIITHKYFDLDSSHVNLIQPLYSELLAIENRTVVLNNYIFLFSLKFGVIQEAMTIVDEMFSKYYSELLDGNLSSEIAKETIQKLLQLNGYRLAFNKENQDYLKLHEKLFDEFRFLSSDSFKGFETVLKYKVAQSALQQNWNLFNSNLSLINTEHPQLSKFGNLLKILIENLLDENKDKLESLEQYWRYSQKEFKQIDSISPNDISDSIFKFIELQPEYFIYNSWKDFFFGEKQSTETFSQEFNLIINKINDLNETDEKSVSALIQDFVNFYNSFKDDFKSQVEKENQIKILSIMCKITEETDFNLHTGLIEILENEYNYEYGV